MLLFARVDTSKYQKIDFRMASSRRKLCNLLYLYGSDSSDAFICLVDTSKYRRCTGVFRGLTRTFVVFQVASYDLIRKTLIIFSYCLIPRSLSNGNGTKVETLNIIIINQKLVKVYHLVTETELRFRPSNENDSFHKKCSGKKFLDCFKDLN